MATSPVEITRPSLLKIERILCPVDFSDFSAKAYDYAQSLAVHYGAKLFVEHVVQPLTAAYPYYAFPDAWNDVSWNLDAEAEQHMRGLAETHRFDGVQPDLVVQRGLLPESILAFAEHNNVDLIVMGTHGRQGLDRVTMGSVTEKVLRKARCPVLAVRKPAHDFFVHTKDEDPIRLRKILFCTDFSEHSDRALNYALSLAMEYNSELTLLHVVEDVPASSDVAELTAEVMRKLRKPIPSDAQHWCSIKQVVRIGKPYQEIIQLALEAQADLIVMGVRGRNTVDLTLFGSTTHRVLQLGSCPVLAVHI